MGYFLHDKDPINSYPELVQINCGRVTLGWVELMNVEESESGLDPAPYLGLIRDAGLPKVDLPTIQAPFFCMSCSPILSSL